MEKFYIISLRYFINSSYRFVNVLQKSHHQEGWNRDDDRKMSETFVILWDYSSSFRLAG